jgi:putative transposase
MRRRLNADHIRHLLQRVRAQQEQGLSLRDCARQLGVCEMTIRRWRARFEAAGSEEAGRVRELEAEVARLKRLAAELMLDKQMLQDIAQKKW